MSLIPEKLVDLLTSNLFGHLATVSAEGYGVAVPPPGGSAGKVTGVFCVKVCTVVGALVVPTGML